MSIKDQFEKHIFKLQDKICFELEKLDSKSNFVEDKWQREEGGGGRTRIISNGDVFEKGGVNVSVVHGELPQLFKEKFNSKEATFYACGISLVIHPYSPKIPTVHANWRYFEMYDENNQLKTSWFGGGSDLTPYYLDKDDAKHFHTVNKKACDKHDPNYYLKFKKACDQYFYNSHRKESRGIGGIFFDYMKADEKHSMQDHLDFAICSSNSFLDAYTPIVKKHQDKPFNSEQKIWQEIRRGRYVEFNLLHDRGTLFGIKTNGRTESILMSLPSTVRWEYNHQPNQGSEEEKLLEILKKPIDWV